MRRGGRKRRGVLPLLITPCIDIQAVRSERGGAPSQTINEPGIKISLFERGIKGVSIW